MGVGLLLAVPALTSGQETSNQLKKAQGDEKNKSPNGKKQKPEEKKPEEKKTGQKNNGAGKATPNMLATMNGRFLRRKPHLGTMLPDLSAFDEKGKPFSLASTRGNYTVLVFGCLT